MEESDFYPYGTERVITDTLDNTYKFTGHERDGETGLDHTLERQQSPTLCRWLSPDPSRGRPSDPQTWNRYSYTAGNPVNRIDPSGANWFGWDEYDRAVNYYRKTYPGACLMEYDYEQGGYGDHSGCSMVVNLPVPPGYPRGATCGEALGVLAPLDSDVGVLGQTMYFEWEGQYDDDVGNGQVRGQAWIGIGYTFVNRYNLSDQQKRAVDISPGSFTDVVKGGSDVWKDGVLKKQSVLNAILAGPASGPYCKGLWEAFETALTVLAGIAPNPVGDALFIYSGPRGARSSTQINEQYWIPRLNNYIGVWNFWGIDPRPKP
ncbi:MAG: RHS repeat-associated core domain-containing protein [Acidobacteria bacterium]|nr:RHS repeat-associated core domain-containing protein [Acidobacteriota bacterium]